MNKFIFWILVSPLFILGLTVNLHAGQAEPMSFTKRVSSADLVILATVDSAESRIVGGTENATTLKAAAKIYTVLSLNTVDVISDQGLVALSTGVRLYLDGGVVEMPPALEDKFPGQKYLGSINTAVPHVDSSGISKYIILICGNGQQSVPICGGEEGVFPITLDGYVQTADGRPILGLVGDDLVITEYHDETTAYCFLWISIIVHQPSFLRL